MPEIHTIAIISAGALGRNIARAAALAGYRTILEDILPASLRRAEAELRVSLEEARAQSTMRRVEAEAALERLEYAGSVEDAAREADLAIEAVPDELESKLEIFTLLDKICRPHTILATTASSLSLGDIASVTYRAQNCLGMRFSFHAGDVDGVKLVLTRQTSYNAATACAEVARRMSKQVAVVEES